MASTSGTSTGAPSSAQAPCASVRVTSKSRWPGSSLTPATRPTGPACASNTWNPSQAAAPTGVNAPCGRSDRRTRQWHPTSLDAVSMSSTPSKETTASSGESGRTDVTRARRGASRTGGTKATSPPSCSNNGRPGAQRATSPPFKVFVFASSATSAQARI